MNDDPSVIEQYLQFLWTQFQHDWSIFSEPWVLYTIIPAVLYFIFFTIKWWILLVPITLPLSMISRTPKGISVDKLSSLKKEK
tara:strand:- start:3192 stop:3440 length:249 start_codon:yes stop_codon:yes gene_type:complete